MIIGPSGSGKSTLLRTVNRLETIDSGSVVVNGISVHAKETDVNALRSHVGMVQQAFNLFPQMTVLDNITLGPRKVRKESNKIAEARARKLLERWASSRRRNATGSALRRAATAGGHSGQWRWSQSDVLMSDKRPGPGMIKEVWMSCGTFRRKADVWLLATRWGFAREAAHRGVSWMRPDHEQGPPSEVCDTEERTHAALPRRILVH